MARKVDQRLIFKNLPIREKVAQIIAAVLLVNSAMAMLINLIVTGGNPSPGLLIGLAIGPLAAACVIAIVLMNYQKKRIKAEDEQRAKLGLPPYQPSDPYVPIEELIAQKEQGQIPAQPVEQQPQTVEPAPEPQPQTVEQPKVEEPAPAPVADAQPAPAVAKVELEPIKEEPAPQPEPAPAPVQQAPAQAAPKQEKKGFDIFGLLAWVVPLAVLVLFLVVQIFELVYSIQDTIEWVKLIPDYYEEPVVIYNAARGVVPLLISIAVLIIILVTAIRIAIRRKDVFKLIVGLTVIPLLMGLNYMILNIADSIFAFVAYDMVYEEYKMLVFGIIALVLAIIALAVNKIRFVYEGINAAAYLTLVIYFFIILGQAADTADPKTITHIVFISIAYILTAAAMFMPRLKKPQE